MARVDEPPAEVVPSDHLRHCVAIRDRVNDGVDATAERCQRGIEVEPPETLTVLYRRREERERERKECADSGHVCPPRSNDPRQTGWPVLSRHSYAQYRPTSHNAGPRWSERSRRRRALESVENYAVANIAW